MAEQPSRTVHVVPSRDLIDHDTTAEGICPCRPVTAPVVADESVVGFVVTHNPEGDQ